MQLETNIVKPDVNTQPAWLRKFVKVYSNLTTDNLSNLEELYHQEVIFKDPIHVLRGRKQLMNYFSGMYQGVNHCDFDIQDIIKEQDKAAIYWVMRLNHKKLNGGHDILVKGTSKIVGVESQIIFHQDFMDLGEMLYEQVPILGKLIKTIKLRVAQ